MEAQHAKDIGNEAISNFLKCWRTNPWAWLQEIDVQVDLAMRIRNKISDQDRTVSARHDSDAASTHEFSRITCEPYVRITQGRKAIHPDIVIWGDDEQKRRTCTYINSGDWPILWACEIKYSFTDPASGEDDDRERLEQLIRHSGAESATQLVLLQTRTPRSVSPSVSKAKGLSIRREYWQ